MKSVMVLREYHVQNQFLCNPNLITRYGTHDSRASFIAYPALLPFIAAAFTQAIHYNLCPIPAKYNNPSGRSTLPSSPPLLNLQ